MTTVAALTIYSIRRDVDGARVTDFGDTIVPDRLSDDATVTRDFTADDNEWSARLYMWPGRQHPPGWLAFVTDGFGDGLTLPDSAQSSAVIIVKVHFRRDRYYAIAFGGGRYAIKRNAIDPKYGLQVALNAIYEGDKGSAVLDPAVRVQQVNTRTVGANTMRTLRQTNRSADFDVFALDPDGDQLDGITGKPVTDALGTRIRGTDSLRVGKTTSFSHLGEICRDLARYHEKKDYQRRFAFVDNVKAETNSGVIADLNEATATSFLTDADTWVISPPDLLDFDEIDQFEIPELGLADTEISPTQLNAALDAAEANSAEDLATLTMRGLDSSGDLVDSWPLLACLDGQVILDETTYLVDGGQFFRVSSGYLGELDEYIAAIHRSGVVLPPSVRKVQPGGKLKEITEGDYNEIAANSSDQFMLLDKALVTVASKTSPIEVCDVLTMSGQMVHVKRKFSSSSLSHLFAQGYVSSELLSDSPSYRTAIRNKIGDDDAEFRALFPDAGLVTNNFEIVYAIVADWKDRELVDIPFFSKVNLRRYARALRRLQYQVTYADVPVVDP